jgi:transposase-like protein
MVTSLTAKGLTTGEMQATWPRLYGTALSRESVPKITRRVLGEMTEWDDPPTVEAFQPTMRRENTSVMNAT